MLAFNNVKAINTDSEENSRKDIYHLMLKIESYILEFTSKIKINAILEEVAFEKYFSLIKEWAYDAKKRFQYNMGLAGFQLFEIRWETEDTWRSMCRYSRVGAQLKEYPSYEELCIYSRLLMEHLVTVVTISHPKFIESFFPKESEEFFDLKGYEIDDSCGLRSLPEQLLFLGLQEYERFCKKP